MADTGDLGRLLSGNKTLMDAKPLLMEFWRRYQQVYPQHELFGPKGAHLPRERCVPVFIHGDEGTTYKKSAVLLISFQPVIGFGSQRRSIQAALTDFEKDMEKAGIPVNFLRTGFQSRFLCAIAPKDVFGKLFLKRNKTILLFVLAGRCIYIFKKTSVALDCLTGLLRGKLFICWDDLITLIVSDFAHAQQHGINLPVHGVVYPIVLGNKGDWSWLVSGLDWNLQRLCSNHP